MSDVQRIGSYAVERELSADALGVWLRARDERLDRIVALRVWRLRGELAELRDVIRERARAAAAIAHPNLPTVFGREELGVSDLLSVEFIEGDSLEEMLAAGAHWRPLDAARLVIPLADAIAVAHAAGLAHGRIRPASIRVTPQGRPVLLELGVAETAEEARASVTDADARSEDVAALAEVIRSMAAAGPMTDPMFRVEMSLLDGVLEEASRGRSKRIPDGAALRDALIEATTPGGVPRRAQPPADVLAPSMPERPGTGLRRPTGTPGTGNLSVLLPIDRDASPSGARRIAAGLLFGAVLATTIVALRAGALGFGNDSPSYELVPASPPLASAPPPASRMPETVFPDTASAQSVAIPEAADSPAIVPPPPDTVRATAPVTAPERPPAPIRSADVSVTPRDATITRAATGEYLGAGTARLAVVDGEPVLVEFSRPGYVSERRQFDGTGMQVVLTPDSVNVSFLANVPVDVVLESDAGSITVGRTNLETRIPSGAYRVVFHSATHPEWSTAGEFMRAGSSYRISKMDYPTRGSLVVAVPSGWANVSVDGSSERESPARFDNLTDFPHIVRLSRAGYETIIDTVQIVPGQVTSRQYRLQPVR